jgi:AcrR family transcriptional regulator
MNKPATDHKERLLNALTACLTNKLYRDITLADITRAAQVSRRSFYQHFENKDACLLALSSDTSLKIMACIMNAYSPVDDWPSLTAKVTHAYLSFIQEHPALMNALYLETASMGHKGLAARRKVAELFAQFLCHQVSVRINIGEKIQSINHASAIAVIAGINELILYELMDGNSASLIQLSDTAEKLINRMVGL